MIKIYGIKNCDTMKKTFKWLDQNNIDYDFHDYKKLGVNQNILQSAIDQYGWETVINRRGTTWRQLDDTIKETMDVPNAIKVALNNPSIVKRPLIVKDDDILIGFNEEQYAELLNA